MITQDAINLAISVCNGDRNPYRLASWLSAYFHYWDPRMMAELKAYLGIAEHQVDDEVAVGIGGLLGTGRNPRMPRTRKGKIDEELQAMENAPITD